jgi:hypothetical protein
VNDRFVTLLGALGALFIAGGLFFSGRHGYIKPVSRPTSHDRGDYGLAGASRWLQQSGIPVLALHTRYSELPELSPAGNGNLLIVHEPMVYPPRPRELHALRHWIQRGNDLLLMEALADSPEWTLTGRLPPAAGGALFADLGLSTTAPPKQQDLVCGNTVPMSDTTRAAGGVTLKPHPSDRDAMLLQGVREVRIKPEANAVRRLAIPGIAYSRDRNRIVFQWLCDTQHGRNALWQFRLGKGRVWIATYPQIFANRNLALADNAQLLANLIGISVTDDHGIGGAVIFDDMHQGDSTLYDPAAFFSDPRLHASLWLLLMLWMLYLLGYSNRFVLPLPQRLGITPTQFVESLGGFFARHLGAAAGADALLKELHAELARRHGRSASASTLWDALSGIPNLDPQLSIRLRDADARLRSGRDKDLRPLAQLIYQIREHLK